MITSPGSPLRRRLRVLTWFLLAPMTFVVFGAASCNPASTEKDAAPKPTVKPYGSCSEAQADGVTAPILRGDPRYSESADWNHDGRVCDALATPTTSASPTPTPTPTRTKPYQSCSAARAANDTPVVTGEPGYSPKLDPDGDGIACTDDPAPLPTGDGNVNAPNVPNPDLPGHRPHLPHIGGHHRGFHL